MGKKRKAMGGDPLDQMFDGSTSEPEPASKPAAAKTKVTVTLPTDLVERIRDIAWWDRESFTEIVEVALRAEVEQREKERDEAYPPRKGQLKPGRKV